MLSIEHICRLFEERGHRPYVGGPVTQLQHALQTATLAERAGASRELVCAALLHDLGHLVDDAGHTPDWRHGDDLHQRRIVPLLEPLFGPAVLEPIRLHVDAKRYLCAVDLDYLLNLSSDSRLRLYHQGGVLTADEVKTFTRTAYAQEAIQLRRWDDRAISRKMKTASFSHFAHVLHGCLEAATEQAQRESRSSLHSAAALSSALRYIPSGIDARGSTTIRRPK